MPHIPRAVCLSCNREMIVERQGVQARAMAGAGPYYIVRADRYKCELCEYTILCGFAMHPLAEHYQDDFDKKTFDVTFVFKGERYSAERLDGVYDGIEVLDYALERVGRLHDALKMKKQYALNAKGRLLKEVPFPCGDCKQVERLGSDGANSGGWIACSKHASYGAGRNARRSFKQRGDNPHPLNSMQYLNWAIGWGDEDTEMKKR